MTQEPQILDSDTLSFGLAFLAERDADLAAVLARFGPPPLWAREPGFPTLLRIILEQQVSLASARATFERLSALATPLTPASFLAVDDATLRAVGFSRQKSRYGRELAQALLAGRLDLEGLAELPDEDVRAALIAIPGIGPWSAEIYLLMALHRADAWPVSDLGVIVGLQQVKGLPRRPTREEANQLAEPWRPWRSVATRLLWYNYLGGGTSNT
ncbi:MAG: DNA-3-methyladenine glycosylase 2 family protein [Caldilineaceae bacterium]|nr:DNA-3-methyladenine glycosylase 2 family protein [Caldilineaceae bacterium]